MPLLRPGLPSLYLSIFLLALTGLFAKLIPLDAVSLIQLRGVFAAAGLTLFILLRKQKFCLPSIRSYVGVYALGMLLGVHWVTFFHAMQISTVAVGMLSLFSYPMITILLEPFFTKQRIKTGDIFAGVVMFVGLIVMVGQDLNHLQGAVAQGVLWGVFSALLFALRNLIQKYHFHNMPSEKLMFHQVVAVALMLVIFVDYPTVRLLTAIDVFKIALLGIFSTAVAHTLLVFSLKQISAKSVSLISCLQPVIASLLAWYVVKETPGLSVLIGGGLVLSVAAYESVQKKQTRN
ncbi:MAG: DMT family transporter [Desulfuromusa sp.]|jgi:drug/metabolite transporter (DMT)-like permease|nr:DMT family transporter [Desulfuromusa sp.]